MIKAEIRFKNATFMNALEKSKYNSIAELSRVSEISVFILYKIASLTHTSIDINDQTKLAEMLSCNVYDLFEQYEEVVAKSKGYPKKLTKDIPIDSMLSLSSKEVMQLESDFSTNDIDDKESLEKDISYFLNTLKDREKDVLEMHFGLNGNNPKSLNEIGLEFGLSRERVRQIKEKALRRLRYRTRANTLRTYVREKDIEYNEFGYITGGTYSTKHSNMLTRQFREIEDE